MKIITITALVVVIMAVLVKTLPDSTVEYVKESTTLEVVEKEVVPEWAQDEDAVKAAQAVIRKKELEAKEAELVANIKGLQTELDTVRKELGTY